MIEKETVNILPTGVLIHLSSFDPKKGVFLFSNVDGDVACERQQMKCTLRFPLLHSYCIPVEFSNDVNDIIEQVQDAYRKMFRDPKRYGVRSGYSIDDLYLDGIIAVPEKNELVVSVSH